MNRETFKSIFAGVMISIGATAYLCVGGGVIGSILFSIGLIGVVTYGLDLFTGKSGFLPLTIVGISRISLILLFNLLGVALASICIYNIHPELIESCHSIIQSRLNLGIGHALVASIGCGIMMSLAITGTRNGNFIPLLFAVPCFILCGFYHCIADAFYYIMSDTCVFFKYLPIYITTIVGNWIGCNIQRFMDLNEKTDN